MGQPPVTVTITLWLGDDLSPHSECGRRPVVLADPIVGQSFTREPQFKGTATRTSVDKVQVWSRAKEWIGIESGRFWCGLAHPESPCPQPFQRHMVTTDRISLCHRRAQLAIGNIIMYCSQLSSLCLSPIAEMCKQMSANQYWTTSVAIPGFSSAAASGKAGVGDLSPSWRLPSPAAWEREIIRQTKRSKSSTIRSSNVP